MRLIFYMFLLVSFFDKQNHRALIIQDDEDYGVATENFGHLIATSCLTATCQVGAIWTHHHHIISQCRDGCSHENTPPAKFYPEINTAK